ncbi:uncharacterized protein C5orf34 homolog isoform X1 [Halichoeres trimaculatus]|uniref:uncharacterized protein C5orf34 homolog isoform X1 n=1 Tax=Halichoeres trimaculatus TaxID=147232 RepID=UPI003D9F22F4
MTSRCFEFQRVHFKEESQRSMLEGLTMENNYSVGLMIMYEDESVDVRCSNGAQVQLSPCGSEFMLTKPRDPAGHPLRPIDRVRQRTRFTISAYKELIAAALIFRNKYASRPYLPEELIQPEHKKPFFSIDSDVQWPEWSSCDSEPGAKGEIIIKSEEGRAVLMLSPSGDEFSVEFTCNLSQNKSEQCSSESSQGTPQQQHQVSNVICQSSVDESTDINHSRGSRRDEHFRSRSCSPGSTSTAQPKPEEMFQSTTVVQHHSCAEVPAVWCYPLSLARHLATAHLSKPEDDRAEGVINLPLKSDASNVKRSSRLPQALPLTCASPHWHRWKVKDPLVKDDHVEQDLPTELIKVMWCQGVTYRILSGAVAVVEVSPGDGSVMRSNGVLNTYFIHHKPVLPGQVREVTYHLDNLPPDVPGQLYSISSVVHRASRILTCYNEAKQSIKLPVTPSCLHDEQVKYSSKPAVTEGNLSNPVSAEQLVDFTQSESQSDIVAAELEKIKRFNFLLENSHLLGNEKRSSAVECTPAEDVTHDSMSEQSIAEALQRTSKAIQDIDALTSAVTLT